MRDQLAPRYFDTEHAIVSGTVTDDLEPLLAAVQRLQARLTRNGSGSQTLLDRLAKAQTAFGKHGES